MEFWGKGNSIICGSKEDWKNSFCISVRTWILELQRIKDNIPVTNSRLLKNYVKKYEILEIHLTARHDHVCFNPSPGVMETGDSVQGHPQLHRR